MIGDKMKQRQKVFFVTILLAITAASAQAAGMLEIRGGAGLLSSSPQAFEDQVNSISGGGFSVDKLQTFNLDAFFNIPACPLGVGLRHEWLNSSEGNGPTNWDFKANN